MLVAVAVVPSAPALVPELAGPGSTDLDQIRRRVTQVATGLAERCERWVAVGAGEPTWQYAGQPGDFCGFGVRRQVRLTATAHGEPDPQMPLSMLMAAWLREVVGGPPITPVVIAGGGEPVDLAAHVADLPTGLLVVADGANTLTAKAPGGYAPESIAVQERLNRAVAQGDWCAIATAAAELQRFGCPAAVWQSAANLIGHDADAGTAWQVEMSGASAPLGVGYLNSLWTRPGTARWSAEPELASE